MSVFALFIQSQKQKRKVLKPWHGVRTYNKLTVVVTDTAIPSCPRSDR